MPVNITQVGQYLVRFVGKLDPSIDENISGEIQDVYRYCYFTTETDRCLNNGWVRLSLLTFNF